MPAQVQAPVQYSPDGAWWWNGARWVATPGLPLPPAEFAAGTVRYAGFWIRFVAYIIDSVILIGALVALLIVTKAVIPVCDPGIVECQSGSTTLEPWGWVLIALAILYNPVLWGLGGTLGQRALGLRVVRVASGVRAGFARGFLRLLGFILASIPMYLGLMWVGWDPRKQGWHDKIAGTVVVHKLKP
jgi:uncharacterized RDD family membrane protein YckC